MNLPLVSQPTAAPLWRPFTLGSLHLRHRLAMAPMTRSRANADGTPGPLAATYYAQRVTLGLLISEGTQPSADGQGYLATPGIHTPAQVAGWRRVADAVHAEGGHLFIQLMHAGRMAHPDNTPHHHQPVAPSAIAPGLDMFTATGMQPIPLPRALSIEEIRTTVRDYADAAECALEAGADGVEIHAANGYLVQQFLAANTNHRHDAYGGDLARRVRFALEVAAAVAERIGPQRTGIRLSPGTRLGGIDEGAETLPLYRRLVAGLAELDLAYLHLVAGDDENLLRELRRLWPNALLLNRPGRPREALGADVAAGLADVEPVARWALANPDLVARLRADAALNVPVPTTFFAGGAVGYTDYPTLPVPA